MKGLHHVSVGSNDMPRLKPFYDAVMEVLGLKELSADGESVDYGADAVCFSLETPTDGRPAHPGNGVHIAFHAIDRETVQRFHEIALRLGGRDAGPPGPRPEYSPTYYGAFVLDPEGNKIEAVYDQTE